MSEIIESVQNERVKKWSKLLQKKHRDKEQKFLVEGEHLIEEALKAKCVETILMLNGLHHPFTSEECIIFVSQAVLNKISSNQSEVSMIAVCHQVNKKQSTNTCGILLDDIQDPGNMGTIIRTAVSFGYDFIVLSPRCVDIYNDKCIRSTQGALFQINIRHAQLVDEISSLKSNGFKVLGTSLRNATHLKSINKQEKYVLVLGNEGQGVSDEVLSCCDQNIFIEMETFESLNVGVAAGICMYELKYKN